MAVDIRFLAHAAVELKSGDTTVLVDPFITGNPKITVEASELEPTHILLTHGHQDHYGDTVEIAKRTGATVVAITELAGEIGEEGVENVFDPNLGGTVTFDWGWVKLVPAWHTSTTPKGQVSTPAGLLINIGGTLVYHLGDTALFSDLQLIARRGDKVDVALVPIGGHYTMDRHDAVTAVEFIDPSVVIPIHYDTFPPIETDAEAFKADVESQTSAQGRDPGAGRDALRVTHAIVLIEAERSAMPSLGGALADVEGVAEAYSVTGEWDFVAIVRVREQDELAPLITGRLAQIDGHQAHVHDGRLRGLLGARPRGAVLDRRVMRAPAAALAAACWRRAAAASDERGRRRPRPDAAGARPTAPGGGAGRRRRRAADPPARCG